MQEPLLQRPQFLHEARETLEVGEATLSTSQSSHSSLGDAGDFDVTPEQKETISGRTGWRLAFLLAVVLADVPLTALCATRGFSASYRDALGIGNGR